MNMCRIFFLYPGLVFTINSIARVPTSFLFFTTEQTLFPDKISKLGFYQDIVKKNIAPGIYSFDVNTPLWSDGAFKQRFIILPNDSQITYSDTTAFRFPIGTVFVKNFMLDTINGDSASRIYVETRILFKQSEGLEDKPDWMGITYAWDANQLDATLVAQEGLTVSIPIHKPEANGIVLSKKWPFPSQQECFRCHIPKARQVLGFFSAQLNQDLIGTKEKNQLQNFVENGLFVGKDFSDFSKSHSWSSIKDSSKSLEQRVRSYFGANCSSCHSPEAY